MAKALWFRLPQLCPRSRMNKGQLSESTIKSVREATAHMFGLSEEALTGESTQRAVAVPRSIAIYLTRQLTDATHAEIGHHFGGRHHSTVMNSIATIEKQRLINVDLDRVLCQLLKSLLQH